MTDGSGAYPRMMTAAGDFGAPVPEPLSDEFKRLRASLFVSRRRRAFVDRLLNLLQGRLRNRVAPLSMRRSVATGPAPGLLSGLRSGGAGGGGPGPEGASGCDRTVVPERRGLAGRVRPSRQKP